MSTYDSIIHLWNFLGLPHESLDTALRKTKRHFWGDGQKLTKIVEASGNERAKRKAEYTLILNPFQKYCYIHCSNGEDEYGRGDYDTTSVPVVPSERSWGPETEEFVLGYLSDMVTSQLRRNTERDVLQEQKQEVDKRVKQALTAAKRYGKYKGELLKV